MGQTIHFADGVADWLDTSTDWPTFGEEYKNGYPMKMWTDREHMWEAGGASSHGLRPIMHIPGIVYASRQILRIKICSQNLKRARS